MGLPDFITPHELVAKTGWSLRKVKATARELGACRIMGNRMILTPDDVAVILEASKPCPSNSTGEAKSGTTPGRLPEGDYAALRRLRSRTKPNTSSTKLSEERSKVIAIPVRS